MKQILKDLNNRELNGSPLSRLLGWMVGAVEPKTEKTIEMVAMTKAMMDESSL